jgi:predicted phage baseplate assembly protein
MSVPELRLDDLTWADLVELARRAIPAASEGHWTLHAPVDPGMTLVELFAGELEQRLFMLDQVPDTLVRAVMRLLLGAGAGPRPAVPAVAVLQLAAPSGPVSLPAGSQLRRATPAQLVLTTEHAAVALPGAAVTRFEVGGADLWPRLRAGEPVPVFGGDGRQAAVLEVTAGAAAAEHRLYLAVEEPTVARGWRAGSAPPPRGPRAVSAPPSGLGWVADSSRLVALDGDGQPIAPGSLAALALPAGQAPVWEAVVGAESWPLRVDDGTAGLRLPGVVRLRPPAGRTFPATVRVRVRKPAPDTPLHPLVSAVAVNVVVARHRRLVSPEQTAEEPALPLPGRELRLEDAAPNGAEPLDRVLDGAGRASLVVRHADGRQESWSAVDDLAFSTPEQRHLLVDRDLGVLRFGDGSAGRIPRWERGASLRPTYWLGGGSAAAAGPGTDFEAGAGVAATTVTPLAFGQDPEPADAARARAAQQLLRATRAATAADIEELVRSVPGVHLARVHVQLGLDPDHLGAVVPDALTVVCVPAVQRRDDGDLEALPAPGLDDGARRVLAAALDRGRLVGSSLTVRGPAWRAVDIAAELTVAATDAAVARLAERTLRHFLDPLVGGSRGEGWDFGAPVHPPDLSAKLQGALGRQADVTAVRVADADAGNWTDCDPLPLRRYELPLLRRLTITRSRPVRR